MTFFYRNYPYSFKATLLSILINLWALGTFAGGLYMALVYKANRALGIAVGVVLIAITLFLFIYVGWILLDKIAAKWSAENIKTKPNVAYQYVAAHPQEYQRICEENPAFAEKYTVNEKGRLVKRK